MNLTPWIAGGTTVALCVGLSMPIGRERSYRTTYSSFAGLTARFAPVNQSSVRPQPAEAAIPAVVPSTPSITVSASAPLIGKSSLPNLRDRRRRRPVESRTDAVTLSTPSAAPQMDQTPIVAASPLEGIPLAVPRQAPAEPDDSPEALRDAFEADPSKLPLDAKVAADGVFLQLSGLCRMKGRFIMKVAVTNRSGADFFVKELGAYNGEDLISFRSHIRLFVEPGRTREGYVMFAPQAGAQVKIKLKEDREQGRVLEVSVRYPF